MVVTSQPNRILCTVCLQTYIFKLFHFFFIICSSEYKLTHHHKPQYTSVYSKNILYVVTQYLWLNIYWRRATRLYQRVLLLTHQPLAMQERSKAINRGINEARNRKAQAEIWLLRPGLYSYSLQESTEHFQNWNDYCTRTYLITVIFRYFTLQAYKFDLHNISYLERKRWWEWDASFILFVLITNSQFN